MDDHALERRYARVLRLYPAAYRRDRGSELMATLLESAGDRTRPSANEVGSLLLGALRAHAGPEPRSVRSSRRTVYRVAALTLLVSAVASAPVRIAADLASGAPVNQWLFAYDVPDLVASPLVLIALVAALRGSYRTAVASAVGAAVVNASFVALTSAGASGEFLLHLGAAAMLLPLVGEAPRPASGLLRYLPLAPIVLLIADRVALGASSEVAAVLYVVGPLVLSALAALWAAVDERVAMAFGLVLLSELLLRAVVLAAFVAQAGMPTTPAEIGRQAVLAAVGPALLLSVSAVAVRRRALP
ncbi:hypothetical protein [Cryptosporangium arvum]|uniref:Uncharacterized protein n=1 Tax=Cryptosporangium arvum DSM 44712 TaxID=927661 RepID=A0A010ZPK4_9ACTN|nr:hypothetical protein [Cryptosporangium arvum]EXG80614.1 hypothetical protein CryarDRAFT_1698 [Cryptosporangium arvum DSM 44712]